MPHNLALVIALMLVTDITLIERDKHRQRKATQRRQAYYQTTADQRIAEPGFMGRCPIETVTQLSGKLSD